MKLEKMCEGCLNRTKIPGKECLTIRDREHFYSKYGSCFSYNDDPERPAKIEEEIKQYAKGEIGRQRTVQSKASVSKAGAGIGTVKIHLPRLSVLAAVNV